jgi:hypothetical protein
MTGLIRPALDLNAKVFDRTIRGIRCIGTWLTLEGQRGKSEPCLVLLDASRPIVPGRTVPVAITLSNAWRFAASDDPDVGDRQYAMSACVEWISDGYLPNSPVAIMTAINECLRDLYNMPPKPRMEQKAIGDIIIKDRLSGSTIAEKEVTNDVQH